MLGGEYPVEKIIIPTWLVRLATIIGALAAVASLLK
jgi:hypothetical protein